MMSPPVAPSRPALGSQRVELLLFAAGWGANHFTAMLVVYRRALALSPAALGVLFGAYAVGLVPGLVLAGRTSDRRGRRAVVLPASLVAILGSSVLAMGGHGFDVLLAGRLLYGLGMGSVMSPGSVWVQELSSPAIGARRATLALSAGFGFGPFASGLLAELAPRPLVTPFVVHGLLMALAVWHARAVPETSPGAARTAATTATRIGLGRRGWLALAALLPLAPWVFGFAATAMAILPGLMRAQVSRPVIYAALVILTTLMTGVLVQPFTRRLGPRGDRVGLGVGTLGLLLGAHAAAHALPLLVFGVALLVGTGYGLCMTTGLLEISAQVPPEARGTAVGIYYVLTYLGFALPFLHAHAASQWGDAQSLRFVAAAAFVCLLVRALIGWRRSP